jgi:hypothetical protein
MNPVCHQGDLVIGDKAHDYRVGDIVADRVKEQHLVAPVRRRIEWSSPIRTPLPNRQSSTKAQLLTSLVVKFAQAAPSSTAT